MSALTAGELAGMQADVARLFASTAIVLRDAEVVTAGRLAHSWAAVGTYAARLAYVTGSGGRDLGSTAGRAETPAGWWLSLSGTLGTGIIRATDRVTVDGTTYNVDTVHYTPGETVAWRAHLQEGQG